MKMDQSYFDSLRCVFDEYFYIFLMDNMSEVFVFSFSQLVIAAFKIYIFN